MNSGSLKEKMGQIFLPKIEPGTKRAYRFTIFMTLIFIKGWFIESSGFRFNSIAIFIMLITAIVISELTYKPVSKIINKARKV